MNSGKCATTTWLFGSNLDYIYEYATANAVVHRNIKIALICET